LVVVGLPIIQLIAELLFFFWFDYEDTLIIKVLQSSFRLTFRQAEKKNIMWLKTIDCAMTKAERVSLWLSASHRAKERSLNLAALYIHSV